ncbi:glycoside hydrolase family 28 protein [Flammeovirgaceae bacterium SG7u.111]|nr:glycoside hydrolase family 28 protein [Flammeovirgaceae bacterium SG7u.132]WPO37902.1 glycoside hydrolase family 28 protein [Flammeovirgaceae bacterium SG7u.111]
MMKLYKMIRKTYFLSLMLTVILLCGMECSPEKAKHEVETKSVTLDWVSKVGTREKPATGNPIMVNGFGAVNDGKTLNTKAIQAAIDACSAQGGGVVSFEDGVYLTGSLFVKKGVNLQIGKGVEIRGSQNIVDYPEIDTRVAGIEMKWPAALINVIDQKKVAVTGQGTVHAQGKPFWDLYWKMRKEEYEPQGLRWIVDYDAKRPRTVLVSGSSDVTISGITLMQAGFWTVHVLYSEYVTVDRLIIRNNVDGHGPSTDGIDIDSSSFVLIENCDIDCNDDNFCLKAGRDADGLRVNRPAEYIVIRNCISRKGGGLITFGSETSGSIRHVLAQNLKANGTGIGIRFKSATTRGGTVENIYMKDIEMNGVGTPIHVSMNWNPAYSYSTLPEGFNYDSIPVHWKVMLEKVEPAGKGIPKFQNIYMENINVTNAETALSASGLENSTIDGFQFKNIAIEAQKAGKVDFAKNWTFENVKLMAKDSSTLKVTNSFEMSL